MLATRSCSGIMSPCAGLLRRFELMATTFRCSLAARSARFRRFTLRRTQHCTDSRRLHTMAVMIPMYTSTNGSPPRDWLRRTAPAMIRDTPDSIPEMKITCWPKTTPSALVQSSCACAQHVSARGSSDRGGGKEDHV